MNSRTYQRQESIEAIPSFRRTTAELSDILIHTSNQLDERDTNILLLGQTGVGKSTTINALLNYLSHDSVKTAERHKIIGVIPASFYYADVAQDQELLIKVGNDDEYERHSQDGQSATQVCRSFVFPIGERKIRIIDTPGIGDTRGPDQDNKNFDEILRFVSQFNHLNAICILCKPDETRMTIQFRFCVNELLRHLSSSAKDNLVFLFTNGRTTFYRPGQSKILITKLLNTHRETYNVHIPFTEDNIFTVDNESFRYLALTKHGIRLDEEQVKSYEKSWAHSVNEYQRFLTSIIRRPVYRIRDFVSVNAADQMIRILPRPLAETRRLIEENIQRAQECKKRLLENSAPVRGGMRQIEADIRALDHPRTVCTSAKCSQSSDVAAGSKKNYSTICHDPCYLKGVVQETLYDAKLQDCEAFDYRSGDCTVCGCSWIKHVHITYEYVKKESSSNESKVTLEDIDRRITNLRDEARQIQDIYMKLAEFYQMNALLPGNDAFEAYLQHFIDEEYKKGADNATGHALIASLRQLQKQFHEQMQMIRRNIAARKASDTQNQPSLQPTDVFQLINRLYALPINGNQIRQQVQAISVAERRQVRVQENLIKLPEQATRSTMMQAVLSIFQ